MVTLEGVNAKIQRAQDEIERLAKDIADSCEAQRALFSKELRPDVGDKIWVFRGETPIVPIEYSVRLGEVVYNLRSALDQLVWQLVHANYKTPGRHNEFPILDDESHFNEAVKSKLKGVSQESSEKIKEMQPFCESDEWSVLKTLHALCNIDKHRSVIFPYYIVDRFTLVNNSPDQFNLRSVSEIKGEQNISDNNPINVQVRFFSSELKKDAIPLSIQPADVNLEVNPSINMELKAFDVLNPEKYRNKKSDEQQIILILKDCLLTVKSVIDYLSVEIQKHPLFGKRPPFSGVQAVDFERLWFIPEDVYDDAMRQLFKDLGEL